MDNNIDGEIEGGILEEKEGVDESTDDGLIKNVELSDNGIIQLNGSPFSADFLLQFTSIATLVFDSINVNSLLWRLDNMPDVTVFVVLRDGKVIGFKAGYAATDTRYYSWLGGVDPNYRKFGYAEQLMSNQHSWLLNSDYKCLETHVSQANNAMIQLNRKFGLDITGNFLKEEKPFYIMQKNLNITAA